MAADNVSGIEGKPQTSLVVNKDLVKAYKADHDLHVALLMKKHGFTKSQATVAAYATGSTAIAGLVK